MTKNNKKPSRIISFSPRGIAAIPILAIVLIVALVVVGAVYFANRDQGNTNTVATTNTANTNGANANIAPANTNTDQISLEDNIVHESVSGLSFTIPEYLELSPIGSNNFIPSELTADAVVTSITAFGFSDPIDTAAHLDDYSVEFTGSFVTAKPTTVRSTSEFLAYEKSYLYHGTPEETGPYTFKSHLFLVQNGENGNHLLIRIDGLNNDAFNQEIEDIFSSVTRN